MGILFTAATLLAIIAALAALWVGFIVLFIVGWKRKKTWMKLLGGIPALFMVGLGALLIYSWVASPRPDESFKMAFGELPSEKISNLRGYAGGWTDSYECYLRFKTTETEFRRLMPSELVELSVAEVTAKTPTNYGSGTPAWWDHKFDSQWKYFYRKSTKTSLQRQEFQRQYIYFSYDPINQVAYYHFFGLD